MNEQEWFETWFDSPYYHLLYKNRDDDEAAMFISNLIDHLKPSKDQLFLDLACGKGRHSIYLNELGYRVEGLDYSENNIKIAKASENERLHFYRHDMRLPLPKSDYDYILNLFTSFGYFETDNEHLQCLKQIFNGLNDEGTFVLDFLNVEFVRSHLQEKQELDREGIVFHITKEIAEGKIIKTIRFTENGRAHEYKELVRAFTLDELRSLLSEAGFMIKDIFGDYQLNSFNQKTSERLIIVAGV